MKAVLAGISFLLALMLIGFPVYSWGWVVLHHGAYQAWDEVVTSKSNMASTGLLFGFGFLFLCASVLLSGESRRR